MGTTHAVPLRQRRTSKGRSAAKVLMGKHALRKGVGFMILDVPRDNPSKVLAL